MSNGPWPGEHRASWVGLVATVALVASEPLAVGTSMSLVAGGAIENVGRVLAGRPARRPPGQVGAALR